MIYGHGLPLEWTVRVFIVCLSKLDEPLRVDSLRPEFIAGMKYNVCDTDLPSSGYPYLMQSKLYMCM